MILKAWRFTIEPSGAQTVVNWTMYGEKNYMSKITGLIMSMDRMIGREFEKGLADLKTISVTAALAGR